MGLFDEHGPSERRQAMVAEVEVAVVLDKVLQKLAERSRTLFALKLPDFCHVTQECAVEAIFHRSFVFRS